MTPRERTLILATVVAVLGAGTLWGYARLASAKAAAADAAVDLAECSRLASRIEAGRAAAGPTPAAREPEAAELIRRIEAAAKAAGFPQTSIERIEPGSGQDADVGPIQEVPTVVELNGVTLRQLFTFLHAVGTGRSGLQVKQARLSSPGTADDAGNRWSVETTLTYLVRVARDESDVTSREESAE